MASIQSGKPGPTLVPGVLSIGVTFKSSGKVFPIRIGPSVVTEAVLSRFHFMFL